MQLHGVYELEDGRPVRITGVSSDITERKQNEQRLTLLTRELHHRAKNLLTLVQSIARLTEWKSREDFLIRFSDRLASLAASQDILVKNGWTGTRIDILVRAQLAFLQDEIGERIDLQGPPVEVHPVAAEALGMAFHELATNAVKHGSLTAPEGRIQIEWDIRRETGGAQTFICSWIETGGPPVNPPTREGFGTTVVRSMVRARFDAEPLLKFAEEGFSWRLACPAEKVLDLSSQELSREPG